MFRVMQQCINESLNWTSLLIFYFAAERPRLNNVGIAINVRLHYSCCIMLSTGGDSAFSCHAYLGVQSRTKKKLNRVEGLFIMFPITVVAA